MSLYKAKKPKLLLLVTQADFGGAQKYVFDMALGLREGWEVTVATGRPESSRELLDRSATAGIPTKTFDHLRREINPWHDLRAIFEVARYLRKERPDVVLANSSKAEVVASLARLFVFGSRRLQTASYEMASPAKAGAYHGINHGRPKIVATIHGFAFLEPVGWLRKIIYFKFQWIAGRLRDATIVLSEYERQIALRFLIARPSSLHVIPHGIGLINFLDRDTARERLGVSKENTIVGTIANLYATKGLDILIACFRTIASEATQSLQLIIIGEGSERLRLERLVRELGLDSQVRLLGTIPDAAQYLQAFDLFVLPSRKEGFPYTILEAQAAGLPIVATRVGAIPEILRDGIQNILVPPNDPHALAAAILVAIKNTAPAASFGRRAQEKIQSEFSISKEIHTTNQTLQAIA